MQSTSYEMPDWMKTQAGIKSARRKKNKKIARRNINNLRYADDTPLERTLIGTKEPLDENERGE